MKVAVYLRDEFTDANREQLAVILDGARLERLASRDEIKEFFEQHGFQWREVLDMRYAEFIRSDMEDLI